MKHDEDDALLITRTANQCLSTISDVMNKARSIQAPLELRDLSLTLAVLERELCRYIDEVLIPANQHKGGSLSNLNVLSAPSSSRRRKRGGTTLKDAVAYAIEMAEEIPTPLQWGGVASLLHNIHGALRETSQCLQQISSLTYAGNIDALKAAVTLSVIAYAIRFGPLRATINDTVTRIYAIVELWLPKYTNVFYWYSRIFLAFAAIQLWRRHMRSIRMNMIKACHAKLSLLLRLWSLVVGAFLEAKVRRVLSYAQLICPPSLQLDYDEREKPMARVLVEAIPFPSVPYLYSWEIGRMGLLKRGVDVLMSSFAVAWKLSGNRPLLGYMLLPFSFPYFLSHAGKASSYATGSRLHVSVAFARFGCSLLNNRFMRLVNLTLMRIIYCRQMSMNQHCVLMRSTRPRTDAPKSSGSRVGVPTYIFCTEPLSKSYTVRPDFIPSLPLRLLDALGLPLPPSTASTPFSTSRHAKKSGQNKSSSNSNSSSSSENGVATGTAETIISSLTRGSYGELLNEDEEGAGEESPSYGMKKRVGGMNGCSSMSSGGSFSRLNKKNSRELMVEVDRETKREEMKEQKTSPCSCSSASISPSSCCSASSVSCDRKNKESPEKRKSNGHVVREEEKEQNRLKENNKHSVSVKKLRGSHEQLLKGYEEKEKEKSPSNSSSNNSISESNNVLVRITQENEDDVLFMNPFINTEHTSKENISPACKTNNNKSSSNNGSGNNISGEKTAAEKRKLVQVAMSVPESATEELGPPTILYCHGGGFCISLLEMDLLFIGQLTKHTKAVVVVPEYALAPEFPFPCALNELEAIYYWVVQGGLGYHPKKVVLVGESAGGNILAALCVRLAKTEDPFLTRPDGLVMGYPGLNLALSPSPSRSLHMCDPLLGYGVLHTCCGAYVGANDATTDAEISPAFAPQNVLADFPLTAIMCGGMDPLLDDAVDFFTHLCRAQRTLSAHSQKTHLFKVFRALPHGFWSMGLVMPATVRAIELACDWAKMMIEN